MILSNFRLGNNDIVATFNGEVIGTFQSITIESRINYEYQRKEAKLKEECPDLFLKKGEKYKEAKDVSWTPKNNKSAKLLLSNEEEL